MTSRICDVLVAIQKRGIFLETYVLVVASNAPVYTGACLLVADRPQAPVRTGANAPVLLSRLRRLLLPAGREKSLSCLLLAVTIFLFFRHAQNPLHVVFGGEQFYHFRLCLPVL